MSEYTPGPWHLGRPCGQHLEHGEDTCHLCDQGAPLLRVEERQTTNPARFSNIVHVHLFDDYGGWRDITADDGTQIIGNYDYEAGGVCTSKADACLVAAVPEMYEVCKKLASLWSYAPGPDENQLIKLMKDAEEIIGKVENGRSNN